MQCFIAFRFSEHLWSHDAGKASHWEGSITQTTNLLRIHVHVFSLHIICCLFSNCSKSSNTRLQSLNITFYLCCKCATFLCARTPRNVMRHSIEICLILGPWPSTKTFSPGVMKFTFCILRLYDLCLGGEKKGFKTKTAISLFDLYDHALTHKNMCSRGHKIYNFGKPSLPIITICSVWSMPGSREEDF